MGYAGLVAEVQGGAQPIEHWYQVKDDVMTCEAVLAPDAWAELPFGQVELGDRRRAQRAVRVAEQMARHPAASIPEQAGNGSATKASDRLFNEEDVTFEALSSQHWASTRREAGEHEQVLLVQDTSSLNFTAHHAAEGLGPMGNHQGRGFMVHSTLAVNPVGSGEVLGLAYQMLFCRQPTPEKETRSERRRRDRESEIWRTRVREIGCPPSGTQWIYVCDRYADDFETYETCRETGADFVIRVAQDRRAALGHEASEASDRLLELARSLPPAGGKTLWVRQRSTRQARRAKLLVGSAPVTVFPPWLAQRKSEPLRGWVVRVWEMDPPKGEEPIEWVLLTTVPVADLEMALTLAYWYSLRWLIEEYYKCLKTGCSAEKRQLAEAERLRACIGVLAVVAVRLLQLKQQARVNPDRPAVGCAPQGHVQVLAVYLKRPVEGWTVREFWREVARRGGFLARKSDGDPGWQTVWRGWQKLDLLTIGAGLAESKGKKCG
ncbi:MAG: IS4 family transposase [Planctomycetes bacterium]|nr:IS4 family transposase [Planctomycetota bacterium]